MKSCFAKYIVAVIILLSMEHCLNSKISVVLTLSTEVQSYPGYPNTFGQRGFIGCSDKRNCSDNPNETFLAIYTLYNIKSMYEGRA